MKFRLNIPGMLVFILVILLWSITSASRIVSPFLLPSPATVLATGWETLCDGTLIHNALVSIRRILLGYALAVAVAVPLGLVFSVSSGLRKAFEPLLDFVRQIPPLAMMPLLILWLGIGEAQKIGVIVLACFFPIFLGVIGGIAQCDPKLIEVGRACDLDRFALIRRVVLPASLPSVVVGLRVALGFGWRAVVGAELVASSAGLGYMIVDAENLARTDIVLVGILVIGCLGMLADVGIRALIGRQAPWLAARTELRLA